MSSETFRSPIKEVLEYLDTCPIDQLEFYVDYGNIFSTNYVQFKFNGVALRISKPEILGRNYKLVAVENVNLTDVDFLPEESANFLEIFARRWGEHVEVERQSNINKFCKLLGL